MGLALGMALKFYTSVAKGLKVKVRKFLGLIPTFVEVTEEKLNGVKATPMLSCYILQISFLVRVHGNLITGVAPQLKLY